MANITTRSKIAIRTTTAPADMGYGGTPTNWKSAPADIITSPGKAIEHLRALKRQAGGTFYAVDLRCGAQPVTEAELMAVVIAAEERRYYAR